MSLRLGRYETFRPIASGGMATVYLGRTVGAGGFERLVAVKVMHPHIASEPDFVAMFLDEARLAARVRHPNVVATIDLVEDPLFLVMEYIDGPSLHALLRECSKVGRLCPIDIALRIFLDLLAGLHAAHELTGPSGEPLKLVHRDVSPQNVLVGSDGISRITDFGVARAESRLATTRGDTLKGKLGYMAPEQLRAEQVDRRSDIYAAGVVLWESLTQQKLFKAENEGALITKILEGAFLAPSTVVPEVPWAIEDVCMRALRRDRDERFPTAAAFADAIEQAVGVSPGISIASSRAVGGLIKELGLYTPPEQLGIPPADPQSSGPRSRRGPPSSRRFAETGPMSRPLEQVFASPPDLERANPTVEAATISQSARRTPRGRRLFAGVATGLTIVVAVVLGTFSRSERAAPGAASVPSSPSTVAATAREASASAPSAPQAPTTTAEASTGRDASASAKAGEGASVEAGAAPPPGGGGAAPDAASQSDGTVPRSNAAPQASSPTPKPSPSPGTSRPKPIKTPAPFRPTQL